MRDGILSIRSNSLQPANVVVRSLDQFKLLRRISVKGQSTLVAKDLRSEALVVDTKTSGNIKIEGVMNLNRLTMDNTGEAEIYWVDSHSLDVDVRNGGLVLGGRTDRLVMRATDSADLDAQGLIANDAWVAASGQAMVQVFPLHSLYAYSKDNATVDVKYASAVCTDQSGSSVIVLNYIDMEKRTGRVS